MITGVWTGRRVESTDDYLGVLIPLEDAHQHSHSYRIGRRPGFDEASDDAAADDAIKAGGGDEGTAMLEMSVPEYSIEGLRREVRRGGKGERWTAYESERPCC